MTFHSHSTSATYSILGEEKIQQSLEGAFVTFCTISRYELSPAFVSHEYFTLPPRLTTGEAVYSKENC